MPAVPKHPSARSRSRRRDGNGAAFRVLSGREVAAPPWPLAPDTGRLAELETLRDKVARLQVEIEAAEDGRTKARLTRQREQNELRVTKLTLELEQAADAEQALWAELWSFPQAEMWQGSKSHRSLAVYVRLQIRAEQGDLKAAVEARQREDRLGLNDLSLLRLRAEVQRVEDAEEQGARRRTPRASASIESEGKRPDPRDILRGL